MNIGFPGARIDLDRLRAGPVEWAGDLPADPAAWDLGSVTFASPPHLRFRAERGASRGVRVTGRLRAVLEVECRRCLRDLGWPLEIDLEYRFDPAVSDDESEEGVFGMDAEAPAIDLTPALREELLLAAPAYPVCRDDCRGLCPRCGADRNEVGSCGCGGGEPDPRWDALKEMATDTTPGPAGPAGATGNEE